jgi:hypothetical protein
MRARALFVFVAALALAPCALGSTSLRVGIQDDSWLQDGAGALGDRLDTFAGLGVEIVRYNLRWDDIATSRPMHPSNPRDPAYDWGAADSILDGLHARGLSLIVGLVGTPPWANGGRGPAFAPSSNAAFAAFAHAAAKRYGFVRDWLVWNEPNQRRWLRPTSPAVYVERLLNPAYAAIKRANPRAKVGGGVTAPRASTGGVSPVAWIAGMKAAHARLDAYAHHPYPVSPRETPTTGGCEACDTLTMATLDRLSKLVTRAFGPKRIWLTEYGYQTNPPDPFGVRPAVQARYLRDAIARAYTAPRVDVLVQFLYQDEPELDRWQSGLVRANGRPKPALTVFRRAAASVGG